MTSIDQELKVSMNELEKKRGALTKEREKENKPPHPEHEIECPRCNDLMRFQSESDFWSKAQR